MLVFSSRVRSDRSVVVFIAGIISFPLFHRLHFAVLTAKNVRVQFFSASNSLDTLVSST